MTAANMGHDWRSTHKTLTGVYIRDFGHVPFAQRLIETAGIVKHCKEKSSTRTERGRKKECQLSRLSMSATAKNNKTLTVVHIRDFRHVPVSNHSIGATPLAAWNDTVSIPARIARAGIPGADVGTPCLII